MSFLTPVTVTRLAERLLLNAEATILKGRQMKMVRFARNVRTRAMAGSHCRITVSQFDAALRSATTNKCFQHVDIPSRFPAVAFPLDRRTKQPSTLVFDLGSFLLPSGENFVLFRRTNDETVALAARLTARCRDLIESIAG